MTNARILRARRGLALATAIAVLVPLASSQVSLAKTTKKGAKKAAVTTKKAAGTARKAATTTTAVADQPKNITGMEVPPGEPIKIGVPYSFSEAAFPIVGDIGEAYEIAFAALRKKGELPVHGRDVAVIGRKYTIDNPANAAAIVRGACTALVQDDKVFAALTWAAPPDCLAENKIPTIGSAIPSETMQRVWPYAFSFQWDPNWEIANVAHFAHDLDLLKGRTLGIYHGSQVGRQKQVDDYFKPELKKLGYSLAEDLAGGTNLINDPAADRVAVQRFKAAGVNTIFLSSAWPGEFGRAAQAQGYKPKYIFGGGEGSIICDGCPARAAMQPTLFDGSYAMAVRRIGENGLAGNPPPTPAGVECAETFEKFSGQRTRQAGSSNEQQKWQSTQWTCDGARAMVAALKAAGPKLTQGALINALETSIKGQQSGLHFDYSWSRTSHYSQNAVKTLQLEGDCLCWRARGGPRKPYVT